MDLLDEFKYQSYKSSIESLTGTKKPLIDLLKELTTKYATNAYSLDAEQQVSNLYYVLLTNLIVTNCSAKSIMTRDIANKLSTIVSYCYKGLNADTIKHWDILVLCNNYKWSPIYMDDLLHLNNILSQVPYSSRIELDFYHIDKIGSLITFYGEDKRKVSYEYIKIKLGADATVLQYYKLNDSPYKGTIDPQVYFDLAQAITNLKEIKWM